jgi:ethanolamine ammonia-lyase large subunit
MRTYTQQLGGHTYQFAGLVELLARASPQKSGDELAGCAAGSSAERAAARYALADVPLAEFLEDLVVPYDNDEITRLIVDTHDRAAFAAVAHLTVGGLRDHLLTVAARPDAAATFAALAPGLMPEMVSAVSKLMRNQDLIAVARRIEVTTAFRDTLGLPGRLATRLQPNHPTDDARGVAAATLDGLLLGCGDAVIGINPASDSPETAAELLRLLDDVRSRYDIPTQTCVLAHVTTTIELIEAGAPVDLVFQSIGGTAGTNSAFGVDLALLEQAREAALGLGRGTVGQDVMYFETGQGSAYGLARQLKPLIVNTVVGFIGPEYLFDGRQIVRAGLEDHFTGKLLGLPMGVDVCYTNHAEADSDDMDSLLTLLAVAGCTYVITVPGADDVMLGYQSLSYHDALYARAALGLRPAPEFEAWLDGLGMLADDGSVLPVTASPLLAIGS